MKWSELTPEQRNALVAEKIGLPAVPCTGRFVPADYVGSGRQLCISCGAKYTYPGPMVHNSLPPPHYSESMDAAWQIVEKMKEATWGAFCLELDGVLTHHKWDRSQEKPYVTWFEQFLWSLNAEGICLAALRVCKVELDHDD